MAIEIRDYDDAWPSRAAAAAAELDAALPGVFTRIEHIGSTAVPGLAAAATRNEVLLRDHLRGHPADALR